MIKDKCTGCHQKLHVEKINLFLIGEDGGHISE
jgi:hypothetical protein